jgi:hypothetical protein
MHRGNHWTDERLALVRKAAAQAPKGLPATVQAYYDEMVAQGYVTEQQIQHLMRLAEQADQASEEMGEEQEGREEVIECHTRRPN